MTDEKASSAMFIFSVNDGIKYVKIAVTDAQIIAQKALDLIYGTSESAAPSVRVSEYICKNTESPDHPHAAAARMSASRGSAIDVQDAQPEVSSKNENSNARRGKFEPAPKSDDIQPTKQVKKVTNAQTEITEDAAETTDEENRESAFSLLKPVSDTLEVSDFPPLLRNNIPQSRPEKSTVQ